MQTARICLLSNRNTVCLFNLNEGEPTFFCTGGGQSVIDHILCLKSMINRSTGYLTDTKVELYTGAPNRGDVPLWNSFSFGPSKEGNPSPDWSKANWDVWRHTLDTHVASQWPELVSTDEPFELWNRLLQLIRSSVKGHYSAALSSPPQITILIFVPKGIQNLLTIPNSRLLLSLSLFLLLLVLLVGSAFSQDPSGLSAIYH